MTYLDTKRALMEEFEKKFVGDVKIDLMRPTRPSTLRNWLSRALDTVRRETVEEAHKAVIYPADRQRLERLRDKPNEV